MAVKKFFDTKKIVLLALMLALTIIFCFVPISFGPVTLAFMILPTLIVSQSQDFWSTVIIGFLLGIVNYIAWFTTKAGLLLAPIFQNPLVCILPRLLIGVAAWLVRRGLSKVLLKAKFKYNEAGKEVIVNRPQLIAAEQGISAVATAIGVIVNTLFVGAFTLIFFNGKTLSNGLTIDVNYILAWFGLNFGVEVVAFSLITPPIVLALKKAKLIPQETYAKKVYVGDPLKTPDENADICETPVGSEEIQEIEGGDGQEESKVFEENVNDIADFITETEAVETTETPDLEEEKGEEVETVNSDNE